MRRNIPLAAVGLAVAIAAGIPGVPARAGLDEGVAAYEAGNMPLALKEFRSAADKGDANCQYNLALMYEKGIGVGKDEKEALAWYRKSAEQGNSNAQFNLGVLYENGRGATVDFEQARKWYRKAAAQGDALAIGNLGMLYLRGDDVKADKVVGLALLMRSATMDPSPANFAKENIAKTKGLTAEVASAAQALASELGNAKDILVPLDQYLKTSASKPAEKSK